MAKQTVDQQVMALWNKVQAAKKAVAKAEKPNWLTNGQFRFNTDSMHGSFDIKTCTDQQRLLDAMSYLINREGSHTEASEILGIKGDYKHLGFSRDEWENDLVTRAGQIDLSRKKALIAKGEAKLEQLLPEDERKRLAAESIASEMGDILDEL